MNENVSEIGSDILMVTKNLTTEQRNKLMTLSLNVKNKATKKGFPIYGYTTFLNLKLWIEI